MKMEEKTRAQLLMEMQELQMRLEETEAALDAMRKGEVEAHVARGPTEQVCTLGGVKRGYRVLLEALKEAAAILTPDGRILYSNGHLGAMLKIPIEQVLGASLLDYVTLPDLPGVDAVLDRGRGMSATAEVNLKAQDGSIIPVSLSVNPLPIDGSEGICVVLTDKTEQERIGEALQIERQRLFSVLDTLPVFVFLVGEDCHIRFVNRFFRERFGDVDGKYCYQILPTSENPCQGCPGMEVIHTKTPQKWQWTHYPSGRTYEMFAHPFRDIDGSLLALELGMDITERKRAEEEVRAYTERLERSNRDLQDFAFTASHDLQEPLRKVRVFGDRLSARYHDVLDEAGRDYLERMVKATNRMEAMIASLLNFSRVAMTGQPFTSVDLSSLIQEVLADLEIRIEQTGGHVEIGKLPFIEADPSQMRQLFQNLITNALKFHGEEKPIVRIYGNVVVEPPPAAGSQGKGWCRIYVEDNGIGFDEKNLDSIFKLFQRLHGRGVYEGAGMGLAICRKIVERHGGSITAKSRPGEGATFIVTLPVKQAGGTKVAGHAESVSAEKAQESNISIRTETQKVHHADPHTS